MSRGGTINSESVDGGQLRAFIERVERMQEERKAISDDIAEIYAEAKGTGFDTKVMRTIVRIRAQDHNERMEQEAILDLYMAALGMQAAPREDDADEPPAPARARASTVPALSATPGGPADGAEPDLAPVSSASQSSEAAVRQMRDEDWPDRQAPPVDTQSQRLSLGAPADGRTFMPALESDENRHPTQQQATSNVTPIRKQWTFADKAHADCLNPTTCGGFSNLALCEPCKAAAKMGQVA